MELINSVPQPTATTFAFPSVCFLFYVSTVQYCITIFSLSTYDDLSCPPPSSVESRSSYGADLADKEILDLLLHNKRYDKRIKPPAPGPLRYTSHTPRFSCLFLQYSKAGHATILPRQRDHVFITACLFSFGLLQCRHRDLNICLYFFLSLKLYYVVAKLKKLSRAQL